MRCPLRWVWRWLALRGFTPAALALLLAPASLWFVVIYQAPGAIPSSARVWIGAGSIVLARGLPPAAGPQPRTTIGYMPTAGWHYFPRDIADPRPPIWRIELYRGHIRVPLAAVAVALAIPPTLIHAARRRHAPGTCPSCGYSRAGLRPRAACPECGTTPAAE